jgi:glycosyltransferase involved in cell wall biosynthesis
MVQGFARTRLTSLRRAFGQTGWGRAVSRWRRNRLKIPRALPPDPAALPDFSEAELLADAIAWSKRRAEQHHPGLPAQRSSTKRLTAQAPRREIRNVLFISHCDFTGNSALHAYRIASALHARGFSPVIAVPDDPRTVEHLGRPPFAVISYSEARTGRFRFADGGEPDLVHAFTPRERVRKLAVQILVKSRCPYVVHLEDNDRAVLSAELETSIEQLDQLPAPVLDRFIGAAQMHPLRGRHFVEHASGVSVVIDRLLELAPADIPTAVVRPGFEEAVLSPDRSRDEVRAELGIRPDDYAVVYTGTIHPANLADMRRLYVALAALRRDGHPIVFVKTGWNAPDAPELQQLGDAVRNLGWIPRAALPGLLAAADALVQPGVPGPFNDYRFPAKLPDFLASGKPVVLSRANIGEALEDGREAFVLEGGTAAEIYRALEVLRDRPDLAREIGERGREFALRELRWSKSVDGVERLYGEVMATQSRPVSSSVLELDPPVRVVALVPRPPDAKEARLARRNGIYGFCFPVERHRESAPGYPFCFRIGLSDDETTESCLSELSSSSYITVSGAPLLLCDDRAAAHRWRDRAEQNARGRVHFTLVQDPSNGAPGGYGFDSLVEPPDAVSPEQLDAPLPEHLWFRSVVFPSTPSDRSTYEMWLRKLVLQALGRGTAQEPLIFVEPRGEGWLRATRSAVRDGIQRFYTSRRVAVGAREIEAALRLGVDEALDG